jgi:hypothetical protein
LLVGTASVISLGGGYNNINSIGSSGGGLTAGTSSYQVAVYANSAAGSLYTTQSIPLTFGTGNTERARIDTSGNLLVGTTTATGMVTVNTGSNPVVLGIGSNQSILSYTKTQNTGLTASSTTDVFRFLNQSGSLIGLSIINGHFYVYAETVGGNSFSGTYSIITNGNGTLQASLTTINTVTRGTSPVSAVQIANDGSGGAIKLQIVTNSSTGTTYFAQVMFVGMVL